MNAVGVEGVWKFYGDYPALRNVESGGGARRVPGADRAQRRGQDDAAAHHRGFLPSGQGQDRDLRNAPRETDTRRSMGYIGHGISVYDELSALENLTLFGKLYGLARSRQVGAASGWSAPGWNA